MDGGLAHRVDGRVINTVVTTRMAVHGTSLREQVTWARPGATNFLDGLTARLSLSDPDSARLRALTRAAALVHRQALTPSYNDVLMLMAFFITLPLTMLLARPSA
ncbi:MAG: hypothetical protein EXR07_12840 [Acetobacteraceae bacterium]|nr:hypothetical protein [Acetobacteraceae bacterium]